MSTGFFDFFCENVHIFWSSVDTPWNSIELLTDILRYFFKTHLVRHRKVPSICRNQTKEYFEVLVIIQQITKETSSTLHDYSHLFYIVFDTSPLQFIIIEVIKLIGGNYENSNKNRGSRHYRNSRWKENPQIIFLNRTERTNRWSEPQVWHFTELKTPLKP